MNRFLDRVAQESVDFQPSQAFFKELVLFYTDANKLKPEDLTNDSEMVKRGQDLIRHHTGLKAIINFGKHDPQVNVPALDRNNVLVNSFIREMAQSSDGLKMIGNGDGVCRGTVNIKTGKVTGIFSEFESTIQMPIEMVCGKKFTVEEMAGLTLHEVGHLFVYCEYMARSITTNQVLAGMARGLDGSDSAEQREVIFLSVKKALRLKDLDAKKLAQSKKSEVAAVVVVSNVATQTASEIGSNIYDFNTWEALADDYAARQGAGRHVVTALGKLYKGYFLMSFRSLPEYLAYEALKAALIFLPIFYPGAFAVTAFGRLILLGTMFTNIGIGLTGMDTDAAQNGDGNYNKPEARFKRVRNQITENLKSKDLTPKDRERLLADIVAVDEVLAMVTDRRQFLSVLLDTIIPSYHRAHNQEVLQQQLEDLAANDLFVQAQKLRSLA